MVSIRKLETGYLRLTTTCWQQMAINVANSLSLALAFYIMSYISNHHTMSYESRQVIWYVCFAIGAVGG